MRDPSFLTSLVSGGTAGLVADISLFPLDTVKTRLQSKQGFRAAGGFRNIYSGLGPAIAGSAPNAALFFCTYDTVKKVASRDLGCEDSAGVHFVAASLAEVVGCIVRVPVEIVKQRRQAGTSASSGQIVRETWSREGARGFYRGFLTTVAREVPFSMVQLPLWEWLKLQWARHTAEAPGPGEAGLCGAAAGGVAAAVTTPLDVAKTRIMLARPGSSEAAAGTLAILRGVAAEEAGLRGLFAGLLPRTVWMTLGGAVFFGVYELCREMMADTDTHHSHL